MSIKSSMIVVLLLTTLLGLVSGSAPDISAASYHEYGRRTQTTCGQSQCYIEKYGQCFHATSYECTTMKDEAQQGGMVAAPPSTASAGSDADEDDKWIETEVPALFQMLNVDEDYSLSSLDRARILSKVRSMVEEVLDDSSSQIISVESPGEYIGSRRLQSSLLRGGGGSERRLNKTLYLPIIVTVRVREDMVGMISIFLLQVLRDKLSEMMEYLKTLNASAFRNVEVRVRELDLSDVDTQSTSTSTSTNTSTSSSTNTNSNSSTSTSTTTSTNTNTKNKGSKSNGTPAWVWVIVALVLLPLFFCLLLCMCRAGWCLCCTGKNKEEDDYELQKQLAIEKWRKEPVQKQGDDTSRIGAVRFGNSVGSRPDRSSVYERRRRHEARRIRRHDDKRRVVRRRRRERRQGGSRRTRSDMSSRMSSVTYENSRARPLRPMVKRSLSKIEIEIARDEMSTIEEGSKAETESIPPVLALPVPTYPSSIIGRDPSVQYQYNNALVVYGALEPEAPKIDDLPNATGDEVAVYNPNPPKEPEGLSVAAAPLRRSYRHLKDQIYVCKPEELPQEVREKTEAYLSDETNDDRVSSGLRHSFSDKLRKSLSFKWNESHGSEDDGVKATLGDSDSNSMRRRKKSKKDRKKRSRKRSKDRSSRRKRHESSRASIDIEDQSSPSILTAPPEDDLRNDPPSKSSEGLFSSFRRFKEVNNSNYSDEE